MKTSAKQQPKTEYATVIKWERSLDPWHANAFPKEFRYEGTAGERKSGWMGLDWVENPIVFVPDGTEET